MESNFLKTHAIAFEARMSDPRCHGGPSMTFWVIRKDDADDPAPDKRKLLMRVAYGHEDHPNAVAMFNSDGSVLFDTSDTETLPTFNINEAMNADWAGDPMDGFANVAAEFMAAVSMNMLQARSISILTGQNEQEVFDRLAAGLGKATPITVEL